MCRKRAAVSRTSGISGMHIRTRKFLGTILLLLFLAAYALAAMLVAVALQVNSSKFVELVYYVVAGLAWVFPAGLLIRWMQRPDAPPPESHGAKP